MEAMYIYTYRKHLIEYHLNYEEYCRIIELDSEWEQFIKLKNSLKDNFDKLALEYKFQMSTLLQLLMKNALQLSDLQNFKDYYSYLSQKLKYKRL